MSRVTKKSVGNQSQKKSLSIAAAVGAAVAAMAAPLSAATVTWTGTVVDPNLANYTLNTATLEGYTAGDPIYVWNTGVANFSPTYSIGDTAVLTDTTSAGRFIRVASGNLNPTQVRFADNGATPVNYTFLRSTDFTGTGYGASTLFGANHDTTLLLDTGFNGKVTLRQGGVPAGLSTGTNSNTIIRSGILELSDNNQLPNNGNNQFPAIELAGGELRFSFGLNGAAEPASTQYRGVLTVSENSTITGNGIDTTPGTTLNRVYGDGGIVNIAAGKTLTMKSLTGVILRYGGNMTGAGNVGTFKLEDSSFQTRLQLGQATSRSTTGIFDLGTGTSILETRDLSATATIDLGALTGGAGTTLRGSANNANVITFSVGARGDNTTFAGSLTNGAGSGGTAVTHLTKVGTSTLTLAGATSNTGATTVNQGTLVIGGAAGAINAGSIAVNSGGLFRVDNAATNSSARLGDAVPITLNQGNFEFVGNLPGATAEAAGALNIAGGSNTVTSVASGVGGPASITFASLARTGGVVNFAPATGANIALTAAPPTPNGIIGAYATVNGNDWATLSGSNIAAYAGYTTNTAPGTWAAGNNINLTAGGLVSVTAPTTINSLRLSSASTNLNIAAGQTLNLGSGGLLVAELPAQTISGPGSLTAGAGATDLVAHVTNAGSTVFVTAPIVDNGTGAVKLIKAGAGKLVLSGSGSTFTGGTELIGGTLQVGVANYFPAGSNLTINYNTAFDIGGFNQGFGTVALIDGSLLNSGGAATVTATTAYDVRNGTISAPLAGAAALTKTSAAGTVTLNAVNSYTGGTTVSNGTMNAGVAGALPNGGAVTVNGGSTLNVGAFNQTVGAVIVGNGTTSGGTFSGTTGIVTGTSYDLQSGTISAILAGTAGVTKAAFNTTGTLSGLNTYTGQTVIANTGNTLAINSLADGGQPSAVGASTSDASNLQLGNNTTLSYTGTGHNTNRLFQLNGNATVSNNGTGALNFTSTNPIVASGGSFSLGGSFTGTSTFSPQITDAGAVTRTGSGVWVLANNGNTWGSGTNLNGGTLAVSMLANAGLASPLGTGGINFNGGTLRYTGTGHSTDRLINMTAVGSSGTIEASGTGAVNFTNAGNVSGAGTGTLTFGGTNTGANTFAAGIGASMLVTKTGAGTWNLTGPLTYTGATTVNGGVLNIHGSQTTTASVTVTGTGSKLVVASNGTANRILKTGAITVNSGGSIDLKDNKLLTTTALGGESGGVYGGVQGLVQAASSGGTWTGNGLTTSMPAAATGLTSIGTASGTQKLGIAAAATGVFDGQTITGATTIAMYTYAGDANLDGFISGDDYSAIDFNIAIAGSDGWFNGDFNYDGIISGDDYSAIDFNIVAQGAPFPTGGSAAGLSGVTAVPEPASLSVLGIGAAALLGRRRRRAN